MTPPASARIRMYKLTELGDCFLLTFTSGAKTSRMLIDCGSFRNSGASVTRLKGIVASIKQELNGAKLDVVVGTHQHNDHLSGFFHCEPDFRAIGIEQVWLSWLDDPTDSKARKIGQRFGNLRLGLAQLRDRYARLTPVQRARFTKDGQRAIGQLNEMLGAFGAMEAKAAPELPAKATGILKTIGQAHPEYLRPGRILDLPGLPPGAVRVYVLGPPRIAKDELLFRPNPRKGESYDLALAAAETSVGRLLGAMDAQRGEVSRAEEHYPFREGLKRRGKTGGTVELRALRKQYFHPDTKWRRIDDAWLRSAGSLALFLDDYTNNSSLALAIELVKEDKVLLFPADAQTGNWVSWDKAPWETTGVTTDSLLSRTAFYKVGHHASHNATLVQAFEKLNRTDLVALIPVHKQDPNITKPKGWKMPARNLFKRLVEKTEGRVLQMDGVDPADCDPRKEPAKSAWKRAGIIPRTDPLFIEVEIGK